MVRVGLKVCACAGTATAATSVLLAQDGVWGLRVHDVRSTAAALEVLSRVRQARRRALGVLPDE